MNNKALGTTRRAPEICSSFKIPNWKVVRPKIVDIRDVRSRGLMHERINRMNIKYDPNDPQRPVLPVGMTPLPDSEHTTAPFSVYPPGWGPVVNGTSEMRFKLDADGKLKRMTPKDLGHAEYALSQPITGRAYKAFKKKRAR
jgi:hypothetical protein